MTTSVVTKLVHVTTPFPVTDVAAFAALTDKTASALLPGTPLVLVNIDGPTPLCATAFNGPTTPHLILTFGPA